MKREPFWSKRLSFGCGSAPCACGCMLVAVIAVAVALFVILGKTLP